jgi:hypothetical protein
MTIISNKTPLCRRHITAYNLTGLPQCNRQRFKRTFRLMMVISSLEYINVQGDPGSRCKARKEMRDPWLDKYTFHTTNCPAFPSLVPNWRHRRVGRLYQPLPATMLHPVERRRI